MFVISILSFYIMSLFNDIPFKRGDHIYEVLTKCLYNVRCSMRLGKGTRGNDRPVWCHRFPMISDTGIRRLFCKQTDGRPDRYVAQRGWGYRGASLESGP